MAITRFDQVANNPIIDNYVPLPFSEMKEALNQKQQEYDTQQNLLNTADKQVKTILPQVSEYYKDSKGNDVVNPHAAKLNYYNNILEQKKSEIFNKYKNDLTSSEAKSEIANFARTASNVYNEVAPDALNTEANYKESKKRLDEMKGEAGGYRKLAFDKSLYNLADKQTSRLDTSNVADEHKFEDLDKDFLEGFKADVTDRVNTMIDKGQLLKKDSASKIKQLTEKEIGERYNSFYRTNHLPVVSESADYDIEHIYRDRKRRDPSLTKEKFYNSKSIQLENGKSYTPEEYKQLKIQDDKSRRLNQAGRYAFREEDKSLSTSFLPGVSFDSEGSVVPTYDERSTQIGGEVTGDQPIDFTKIDSKTANQILPRDMPQMFKDSPKIDESKTGRHVISHTSIPEVYLQEINEGIKSKYTNQYVKDYYKKEKPRIEKIVAERKAFNDKMESAKKGDLNALHDYYEETNPVYKNVSDAYKAKFNKSNLTKDDIRTIQAKANHNLQTVQGNQEVTLNPKFDAEALQNVANSVLNKNAVVRNSAGEVVDPKDIIPDYKNKTPQQIVDYLKGGITTYVTPVGRKEAGYKATIDGENYNITYPNSVAVPELRKFKETTSNIFDVNLPSKQEVPAPEKIQESVLRALNRNGIQPESIKYISNRDDWNIDKSTLDAEVYFKDDAGIMSRTIIKIPIFGGKTSVTGLATSINPQTGQNQDMLKYTIKDSESTKNIPLEE